MMMMEMMDFSDPQLISCSLLQPLQSPPPAMSSSSSAFSVALFFPRSGAVSATAVTTGSSRRCSDSANVESEHEFSFLESKPSLMDERAIKGGKASAKGRRHAGEAVLRRKLANQAFLVKIGGCGAGKELGGSKSGGGGGHRRRGRVLSELVADQFAPSVPYSLNRKSRWAQDGMDWLTELAGGWNGQQKLRLSLAEADYSLAGTESVRALHRLDADKGQLQSRWAKSGRGALLADLARSEEEELENEAPTEEMHFQLSRPHSVSRVFAGKFFKRKQTARCSKHSATLQISGPPAAGPARAGVIRAGGAVITESEPEEENEFLAQYRPRRETYSLADFLKDAPSTPPVMVRRPASNKSANDLDDQFAIVPELECIPVPEDSTASEHQQCPVLCALRQQLASGDGGNGFFRRFPIAASPAQIQALADRQEWHPQWLGEQLLVLDLSWALIVACGQAKEPETQLLVLTLSPGELVVNSLIPLDDQKVVQVLDSVEAIEHKVQALLEAVQTDFTEWDLSRQRTPAAQLASLEHLRSIFHSNRLTLALQPLCVQTILAKQRADLGREEGQFVSSEELLANTAAEERAVEEEEFELIDMNELLASAGNNRHVSAPKCADCSSEQTTAASLATLRSCGHRLCRECLGASIGLQIAGQESQQLHCSVCAGQLPLALLPWLLPLPTANALVLLQHVERQQQQDNTDGHRRLLAQCPGCQGILEAETGSCEFQQIGCLHCSLHWCPQCGEAPHWPLNCAQSREWTRRARPTMPEEDDCGQLVPSLMKAACKAPVGQQQQISGQFAEICSEARARRLDARLGWQLGKHMRRLDDSRAERRFGMARKTALHLLEFGTALLYLNRQQRTAAWAQLKSLLWALRDRVECLDNELLFSGSLTDTQSLKMKLAELEQLIEKCLAKLGAWLKEEVKNDPEDGTNR